MSCPHSKSNLNFSSAALFIVSLWVEVLLDGYDASSSRCVLIGRNVRAAVAGYCARCCLFVWEFSQRHELWALYGAPLRLADRTTGAGWQWHLVSLNFSQRNIFVYFISFFWIFPSKIESQPANDLETATPANPSKRRQLFFFSDERRASKVFVAFDRERSSVKIVWLPRFACERRRVSWFTRAENARPNGNYEFDSRGRDKWLC